MIAAALLLHATPLPASVRAVRPVEAHGALRVAGGAVVDRRGRPVALRGVSLFWSQWGGRFYDPRTIRWLRRDWRISVVRVAVGVHEGGYLEHPEREFAKAAAVVDAAIAEGLYVIVDWHAHRPEPQAAALFFERVARRWGHRPNLIYETWNEPLREHGWSDLVKPYHERVIARIRAIDPDNLVVAGTPTWSQDVDVAAADPLRSANTAYTLHFYAGTHGAALRRKADRARSRGAALFVTEWGASEADGNGRLATAETRAWWRWLAARRIGDVNWSIMDKAETSAALRPGAASGGGWADRDLTGSGRMVRERLRGR